jgi:hypothetical protein
MTDTKASNDAHKVWSDDLLLKQNPKRVAQYMIRYFGPAAAGLAFDMVRAETSAHNREAALKWHQVMSLIEDAKRNPRP